MLFQCDFLAFFLCGFLNILVFSGEPIDFGSIFGRFLTFSAGKSLILSILGPRGRFWSIFRVFDVF